METAQASTEESFYAGLPQTRVNKNTVAGYPTDNTTSPNDFVAKVQAAAGSQKIGPSITLKVMKGDSVNIKVSSWYKLNGSIPIEPTINTSLANIVSSLISSISGSAVVNTHGVTSSQFNAASTFTPDVTDFLNDQTNNNYNNTKPKAYLNWIYFDEQFNIVSSGSGAEQVGSDQQFKLHVQQTTATNSGFLYVYVSNETTNIPVYFDNLQLSHVRSPLLETSEYYPYGLKMANISYKASMTMVNRYGFNGGNEYEDEGELNYSNTFYRKYDAQIGRFTGVDMLAEEFYNFSPYNFGLGNPVMFNDPSGALNSTPVNPASFSNARDLLAYIQKNGIDDFADAFNSWTFGGEGNVTSYRYGNDFSYNADRSAITINWSGTIYTQTKTEWGNGVNFQTLNTLVLGQTKIKVQTLWNKALSWGEKHRNATYTWFNGSQNYDAMWQHNYKGFKDRLGRGRALSQKGDRASYTESFGAMQAQHDREQDSLPPSVHR